MDEISKRNVIDFWDKTATKTTLDNKEGVGMLTEGNEYYARARTMEEFQLLNNLVSRREIERVLEVGCGSGRYASYFSERGIKYFGVDISSEMISLAETIHGNRDDNINFQHITDISEINEIFDLVIIGGVTMYLNDNELAEFAAKCAELTRYRLITRDTFSLWARKALINSDYSVIYRTPEELNSFFNTDQLKFILRVESYRIKFLSSKVNTLYIKKKKLFRLLYIVHRTFLVFYKPLRGLYFRLFSKEYRLFGDLKHMFSVYDKN